MLRLRSRLGQAGPMEDGADSDINMAPLIDMVFILLIFFLVTATFVKETGVEIQRPEAATAASDEKVGLKIAVTKEGHIFIDNKIVDVRNIRGLVEFFLVENPGGGVMVEADRHSLTGRVIEVLDQCRLAGAEDVRVAARRTSP